MIEGLEFQTEADALIDNYGVADQDFELSETTVVIPIELSFRLHGKTNIHQALNELIDPFESGSVESLILEYSIEGVMEISDKEIREELDDDTEIRDLNEDALQTGDLIEGVCPNCGHRIEYLDGHKPKVICDKCGFVINLEKLELLDDEDPESDE